MKDLKNRLSSRKLWLAITAALVVFVNKFFDMDLKMEEVLTIVGSLLTFVLVEGATDITKEIKK